GIYVKSDEEDKCLLYQYFDKFVRLFINDSVNINMSLHFINENMKVYNVECEYIGINKSVLLSEILRLNEDLYFGDKNIINNCIVFCLKFYNINVYFNI